MSTSSVGSSSSGSGPVVSVAGNTGYGASGGSVINVNTLVSQLVAATAGPQQALIASRTQQVSTQMSALGQLKGALVTFQSSLASINGTSNFQLETATSSAPSSFTASVGPGAAQGTFSVAVTQLAQAQQLLSPPIAATSFAGGTLSVSLGGTSFNVTVGSNATLADVASAINSASGNPGVHAAVLQGTDGAHLLLSSAKTGAANTIQVSETDAGSALSSLTYGTGNTANYNVAMVAQDAQYSISGVNRTSASNTVSDALDGVSLTLLAPTPAATPATLTLSVDTTTIQTNIAAFVSAYNTLHSTFASLGNYDAASKTAGPMLGNPVLTGIQNQVQRTLYGVVANASPPYNTLASIGITAQRDGTLSVNAGKLSAALNNNLAGVTALFTGTGGVAGSLNTQIADALGGQGTITSASKMLVSQNNALNKQSDDLNSQMATLTVTLTKQYSALNTLLSSLQSTSSYLSQALASLPGNTSSSRSG